MAPKEQEPRFSQSRTFVCCVALMPRFWKIMVSYRYPSCTSNAIPQQQKPIEQLADFFIPPPTKKNFLGRMEARRQPFLLSRSWPGNTMWRIRNEGRAKNCLVLFLLNPIPLLFSRACDIYNIHDTLLPFCIYPFLLPHRRFCKP